LTEALISKAANLPPLISKVGKFATFDFKGWQNCQAWISKVFLS
jgi:hypothetical protein